MGADVLNPLYSESDLAAAAEGRGQLGRTRKKQGGEQRRQQICNGDGGKKRGRQLLPC